MSDSALPKKLSREVGAGSGADLCDASSRKNRTLKHVLRMGPYRLTVFLCDEVLDCDGNACDGTFDSELHEIEIDRTLSALQQRETLFHELIEAANFLCDLELSHQTITTLGLLLAQSLGNQLTFNDAPTIDHDNSL